MKLDNDIVRLLDGAAAPLALDEVIGDHQTGLDLAGDDAGFDRVGGAAEEATATAGAFRRGRIALLGVAAAAAVAVLAGVVVIGGDGGSDSVVLVGAADEDLVPPSGTTQGSDAVDGAQGGDTETGAGEESAVQEAPPSGASPPQGEAMIPWPEPVVVSVSPATTSEANIVDLDSSGLVVLRVQGFGFGEGPGNLLVCGAVEITGGGGFGCGDGSVTTVSRTVELSEGVDVDVVAHFDPGAEAIVVVMPASADEPLLVATVKAPLSGQSPRLWPHEGQTSDAGQPLWIDRLEATATVRGTGWEPDQPLIVHACQATGEREIDRDRCSLVGSLAVGADGGVMGEVEVRRADGELVVQGLEEGYLVAVQGEHVEWLPLMEMSPLIATDVLYTIEPPAVVELTVRGLRRGEAAEIRFCAGMQCAPPLSRTAVRGSGSGEDVVQVEVPVGATTLELFAAGQAYGYAEFRSSAPPSSAGSASITIEPASVPAPGEYTFTVTGEGWTTSPPVFILPCVDENLSSCDTGNLTPVTPAAGAFEVAVTYEVDADGLVIAAGDAEQSQSAQARITVGS